jgi:glycosyltransferase involved in cell wall biosynthesis
VCVCLDYVHDIVRVKGDIPLVFESHSSRLASRFEGNGMLRRLHVWYLQQAVRKSRIVVALTKGDADEWRKLTPNVCVIPNVVHLNDSGVYGDCSAKSVIFVGRFSKQKDVGSLLRIWTLVHQRHPDWSLHVYGGYFVEQDVLLDEIRQLDANIHVYEPTPDMLEKYKESSVLLLTSRYEPFGLVLPEAMSCGLPVVAFDCPYGPADIISNGTDGFLVKSGDIKCYVEKVCCLLENWDLRQKMGRAGKQASQRFDASRVMPMWKNVFEQIFK